MLNSREARCPHSSLIISKMLKIREKHGIQCMPCSCRFISEMLLEIQRMEKGDFQAFDSISKYLIILFRPFDDDDE